MQWDGVAEGRILGVLGYEWMTLGGYADSLGLDTNDKGCTRQGKDGEIVRSTRIKEKGTTGRRFR